MSRAILLCCAVSAASAASAHAAVCDVVARGAVGDGTTEDTGVLQAALSDAACGTVLLPPPGVFLSRALDLSRASNKTLRIAPGATLLVWPTPATYGAGTPHFLSAASAARVAGFTLSGGGASSAGGGGRIVGGGRAWWARGAASARPHLLFLPNAEDILVTGVTLVDAPSWNIGLRGARLNVTHVRVEAGMDSCGGFGHAPNTDGANLGGVDIYVHDLFVHNGDDCLPITTPSESSGLTTRVFADKVHCECGTNGAVLYNNGGTIRGVVFNDFGVHGTNQGAGAKLGRAQNDATGGLVTDIVFSNYHILQPRYAPLYANAFAEDASSCALPSNPDRKNWLTFRNFSLINVTATGVPAGRPAGCFLCSPGTPCDGWAFADVVLDGGAYHCAHFTAGSAVRSTPKPCAAAAAQQQLQQLLPPPAAPPALTDVYVGGEAPGGYACFRIPALLALPNGSLLLFAEGRVKSCADHGFVDIVRKTSHDGGRSWGPLALVRSESAGAHSVTIGNPAPVSLGGSAILLPFCRENKEAGVLLSEDGGGSWALLANLTVPANWTWVATGPPGSLRLPSGRIVIPANHNLQGSSQPNSHAYLSDNGGKTWAISATVAGGNEDQAVAMPWTSPPSILLSMRSAGARRLAAASTDGGASWSAPWPTIAETGCEASTAALPAHPAGPRLVMSSAFAATRTNMTLHVSADDGHSWTPKTTVYAGSAAYSSLAVVGDDVVALAFERDAYARISFAVMAA